MLRYVSKFFLEILPSVVATVVGAYIVNHYISPKSPAEAPKAASIVHVDPSPVDSSQPSKNASGGVTPSASSGHDSTSRDARTKSVDKAFAKVQTDKASDTTKDAAKDLPKESIKDLAKTEPDIRHFIARDKEKSAPSETASIAPAIPDEHPDAAELARAALERLGRRGLARKIVEWPDTWWELVG